MNNISIVIPVYNEELNLYKLNKEIIKAISNLYHYEIIYVNDCSIDKSLDQLIKLKKTNKDIRIINNNENFGQSYSINQGITNSLYNTIVTIDADGQNNPVDIPKLVDIYFKSKLSLVGGIRKNRKDNLIKITTSWIANNIRSLILNDHCSDTGCSLKVFDKTIFLNFPYFNGIHRFLPTLFENIGTETLYLNVEHRARKFGISKYRTFDRMFKGIFDIFKVRKIIQNLKIINKSK